MANKQENKTKKVFKFLDKAGDAVKKYGPSALMLVVSVVTLGKVSKKS